MLIKLSEEKLRSHKHLHMLHQTTHINTLHGDHMIEFCGLLRSVRLFKMNKDEMISDVR